MNVYDYCQNVVSELESWKTKLLDVDNRIASLSCGAKEHMLGNIEELHMVIAEIEDRIHDLQTSCPLSWKSESQEERVGAVSFDYDAARSEKADYDFGG